MQALGFLKLGNETEQIGLIVGGTSSAILLALNIKRSIDTSKHMPNPDTCLATDPDRCKPDRGIALTCHYCSCMQVPVV